MSNKETTIRDWATAFSGYAFPSEALVSIGTPVLKISNVQRRYVTKEVDSYYNGEISKKLERYILQKKDFLIAMTGAGSVGRVGKMVDCKDVFLVNQRIAIVRPKFEDNGFLYYWMTMPFVEKYLYSLGIGAGQPNISANDILNMKLNAPSLPTQRRIASILSAYDNLIENNTRRIRLLEQMAENLYKEWFVRFRFPGHEKVEFENGLPKGWKVEKLGEWGITLDTGSRPKGGIDDTLSNGVPSLGAESIKDLASYDYSSTKYIPHDFFNKMKRGKNTGNDILLYKDGAYIGKVTLFRDEFPYKEYAINEHVFFISPNTKTYKNYLYFTLHQDAYFTLMQNLNRNAAQPGLSRPDIERVKIVIPLEDIINEYNKKVEPILGSIFKLAKSNALLTRQRDLLLPRLMSGKLEVKE